MFLMTQPQALLVDLCMPTREQQLILFVYLEIQSGGFTRMELMDTKIMSLARNMKQAHLLATCLRFINMTSPVLFAFFEIDPLSKCSQVKQMSIYIINIIWGFHLPISPGSL